MGGGEVWAWRPLKSLPPIPKVPAESFCLGPPSQMDGQMMMLIGSKFEKNNQTSFILKMKQL